MRVVYVAGPYRCASAHAPGQQDNWGIQCNVMRAMALALEVWRLGAAAVCPHANTMFFQNAAPDDVWLDGDLALLARCDAVVMTDDWARSSGAKAEHAFAVERGIPVFYSAAQLAIWLDAGRARESATALDVHGTVMAGP